MDSLQVVAHGCRFANCCIRVLQVKMKDPMIASDGVCCEQALEGWVTMHGVVSPTTEEAIRADFKPNHMLRSLFQAL